MSLPACSRPGSTLEPSRKVLCRYPARYKLAPCLIRRKRAEKCVARGKARWIDLETIELTERAVEEEYHDAWLWMQQQALDRANQDGTIDNIRRSMNPGELRNIPFVGPDLDRMFVVLSRRGNGGPLRPPIAVAK